MSKGQDEGLKEYDKRTFDEPLIVPGHIDTEPERYIAEKPFDLTRFEYSLLRKPYAAVFWFNLASGATAGVVISVIGKSIAALISKQNPTLETWEIFTVISGICISWFLKSKFKSDEDKEKDRLMNVIDSHFEENKPRHLHLTKGRKR